MQRTEPMNFEPAANDAMLYGEFCETTRRIVIVSPYPSSLNELIRELTLGCYDVLVFRHLESESLTKLPPDLIIMDLSKDRGASFDAAAIPQGVPALFLVDGLAGTADEEQYMQWPDARGQLMPRIQSLLKHVQSPRLQDKEDNVRSFKDLRLDLKRLVCFIGTTRIDLTKTEFDLLLALIEAEGAVISRQSLMDRIWGENYFGGSNTIDVHMKSLRQKLSDNPKQPKYIATVRGVGYRLADA